MYVRLQKKPTSATTLYTIIQKDSNIRFDFAFRLAKVGDWCEWDMLRKSFLRSHYRRKNPPYSSGWIEWSFGWWSPERSCGYDLNDIETEDNRWYANIKFYGNEKGHLYNADMCQFLASLNESQESFESYFTPKDMFDIWKKQKIADYSTLPVTKKVYEDIDNSTRMKLRNEHLERQFKKNQSDIE